MILGPEVMVLKVVMDSAAKMITGEQVISEEKTI